MTKVLICDDHPVVAAGLRDVLAQLPDILVVGSVLLARQIAPAIQHHCPELLFLDLNMGGENMADEIQHFKKQRPSMRVVVFTSYDLPALVARVFDFGADAFLLKNSGNSEIASAIGVVLAGKKFIGEEIRLRQKDRAAILQEKQLPPDGFSAMQTLTEREKTIFDLTVSDKTEAEIADLLFLSKHTVHTHRKHLMKKLGLHGVADFVRLAFSFEKNSP